MEIVCIGGGAAGLYFAISMKLRNRAHDVVVVERNRPGDTYGWGVVFSDQTMERLRASDPVTAERILASFAHWDDIDVHFKGEVITSGGHGFIGISRKRLLNILQERARGLGVRLFYGTEVSDVEPFRTADLVVAADGINSRVRAQYAAHFKPDIDVRANKYVWLGTRKLFEAFTFIFEETEAGWIQAHAYRCDNDTSTFIVECPEEVWRGLGIDRMSPDESIGYCERLFARYLDGHKLLDNAPHLTSPWLAFSRVSNEHWSHENIVLLGDAAHTAHFSIGSGTRLALEDAIDLADQIEATPTLDEALEAYEGERRIEVLRLQSAARNSTEWFENIARYATFAPAQFAYALLTRSQRVSHENLRLRDKEWLEGVEQWFAERAYEKRQQGPLPPMFTPFSLRGMTLMNRVVVSPMAMYSATDGTPDDFHLVHLGARAQGGAALIFTEMTCVEPEGRITPGCTGMYSDAHLAVWKRIVDFVHAHTPTKIGLQLGHSGPKGSTKHGWEGMDEPLDEGNWEVIGPSPIPWSPDNQVPRSMTREDMDRVRDTFVRATRMAEDCGFDMIELHSAHGYLLSSFITPLTNRRNDDYGGPLANRLRFPLEVFAAMREVWPEAKPLSVRISATDWVEGGITGDDAVEIARAFHSAGADILNVSAGQTSTTAKPVYGRMFQTPFSDRIRNEVGIPTMAVGNIYEIDHINSIIAAGRADLCCLARPHLADPYWTLHAASQQRYDGLSWPVQYLDGKDQLERNLRRAADMAINI